MAGLDPNEGRGTDSRIVEAFARLSTGIKMLIILSAALLPLGMIALFVSIDEARTGRMDRETEARLIALQSADRLTAAIVQLSQRLRDSAAEFADARLDLQRCRAALRTITVGERSGVAYAVFDRRGRRLCATADFSPEPLEVPPLATGVEVHLNPKADSLRFSIGDAQSAIIAAGELPRQTLAELTRPRTRPGAYGMALREGEAALWLAGTAPRRMLARPLDAAAPVVGGAVSLEFRMNSPPVSAIDLLLVLLPLLMWAAAAVIGWLVVDRLLLQPLGQMQRAIVGYRAGDGPLQLPPLTTPALEIRNLGEAFERVTEQLASHEAELEEGLARQTRLTREVHHRVKNNLQVVSSLINLHSRGAATPEVASAYASIQRRVDALAVVHRNHYAELEDNLGVGLRALIAELAANLRATAAPTAGSMAITLDVMPAAASQDVAVPVAFLITEIVELAMMCAPGGSVAISLHPAERQDRAVLVVAASGVAAEACLGLAAHERFTRVITGLARQLRAPLEQDETNGRFAIEIAITAANPGGA